VARSLDDLDLARSEPVQTEVTLPLVEWSEPSALAEEPHRARSLTPVAVVALGYAHSIGSYPLPTGAETIRSRTGPSPTFAIDRSGSGSRRT
jgi:hypothetical protein